MATRPIVLVWKSHGQRSLAGYSPWGRKQSDTTQRLKSDSSNRAGHPPSTRQVPALSPEGPTGTFEKVWRFHHLPISSPNCHPHHRAQCVCVSLVPFSSIHLSHPQGPFPKEAHDLPQWSLMSGALASIIPAELILCLKIAWDLNFHSPIRFQRNLYKMRKVSLWLCCL